MAVTASCSPEIVERIANRGLGLGVVGDDFDHEAVGIEKERGVAVGAISRELVRCTNNLVASSFGPVVDSVDLSTRAHEECYVLESYSVS